MTSNDFLLKWAGMLDPVKRQQSIQRAAALAMFRSREHAREVWDDWDGMSSETPSGENAHMYLNIIGDGRYCAV